MGMDMQLGAPYFFSQETAIVKRKVPEDKAHDTNRQCSGIRLSSGLHWAESLQNVDAFACIDDTNVAGHLSLETPQLWALLVRPRLPMLNNFPQNIVSCRAAPSAEDLAVISIPWISKEELHEPDLESILLFLPGVLSHGSIGSCIPGWLAPNAPKLPKFAGNGCP